jgi:hypothetical protein
MARAIVTGLAGIFLFSSMLSIMILIESIIILCAFAAVVKGNLLPLRERTKGQETKDEVQRKKKEERSAM